MTNTAIFILINVTLDVAILVALAAVMLTPIRLLREPSPSDDALRAEAPRRRGPGRRRAESHPTRAGRTPVRV